MANLFDQANKDDIEGFDPRVDNRPKTPTVSGWAKFIFWFFGTLLLFFAPIYYIVKKNNFLALQNSINESSGTIEVQLEQRSATLIKLVDQVRSYREFEKSVLTDVARLRSLASNIQNAEEIDNLNSSIFGRLMAVSENYPELRSSQLYQELMNQTTYLERELAASRRLYNSKVNQFNTEIFIFPNSIVSTSLGLSTMQMYKASAKSREDVSMANL
ncbi:LemA family [Mesomycoplasma dispar]|uniref:LemA family n=1 Tax=Mesomycoplasma dispar TaxID=86660 RepID=A0AAJ5NS80_9BACT|nr:LemA family protein [Mesomycoplasma dispar]AJR12411.1 hypothetical protein MDIS_03540 [Mesomycoplasma dispar]VEU62501.1 LemA family [Mesomycoplasma dispar]